MISYHAHESVAPKLTPPTVSDELQLFSGIGSLRERVRSFGEAKRFKFRDPVTGDIEKRGFTVMELTPGDDVFEKLAYAKGLDVLLILQPGVYREITYRMPGPWKTLWIYGIPGEDGTRPQIQGQRPVGSPYGSPGLFMSVGAGKRMMLENLEISGFAGNAITQSAHADLLMRNCFVHSNGGRALFRGVGCRYSSSLGGTWLIDSEFRDANSHTIYLDYGKLSVVSGCNVSRPQKVSHGIKNISQRTLVEGNTFATGESGSYIEDDTNAWVLVDNDPYDPRQYVGSAPYDGMSGTDFALVRHNRFVSHPSNGPLASLQTRPATNGGHPAIPAPDLGTMGVAKGELDACGDTLDPNALGPMWTDAYWEHYQPHTQYWLDNQFQVNGSASRMAGITLAHNHPVMWTPTGGKPFPVSEEWRQWLVEKLTDRVTTQLLHRGNTFPDSLPTQIDWRRGASGDYCALPDAERVVRPFTGNVPNPTEVDPLLRRWTGVDLVRHWAGQAVDDPIPQPVPPAVVEPPIVEPPVVVVPPEVVEPPVDPIPEPVPEPEKPASPEWETLAVKAEYHNGSVFYRELLQSMKRVTY